MTTRVEPTPQLLAVLNGLPFLKIWQAAVLMGVSESHLRDLIAEGQVPVKRWGKSVRVARRDLDAITGTTQDVAA